VNLSRPWQQSPIGGLLHQCLEVTLGHALLGEHLEGFLGFGVRRLHRPPPAPPSEIQLQQSGKLFMISVVVYTVT
jgi:hypothetical protein